MATIAAEFDDVLTTPEKLNLETAKIPWVELQRLFARGVVMVVSGRLDLVTVATAVVDDQAELVREWLESGDLRRANDNDAREWFENEASVWAVAAAPWVLVQA